ncbi:MAG TPA: hypothetical protein VFI54_15750 [Solirubrobacteraceae bacterium]|nr:hypothetical protein [Solirubrobacteraceae bacterium]
MSDRVPNTLLNWTRAIVPEALANTTLRTVWSLKPFAKLMRVLAPSGLALQPAIQRPAA